jgi:hypothetical protein
VFTEARRRVTWPDQWIVVRFIGCPTFFDFGDGRRGPDTIIDARCRPLFDLPPAAISGGDQPISLATGRLLRHITWWNRRASRSPGPSGPPRRFQAGCQRRAADGRLPPAVVVTPPR